MKAAILEDDPAEAELLLRTLESAGHSCAAFDSGRALLASLRQETFDLLVLDWNLPDIDGVDIAAWVRKHEAPPPPILMVTARSTSEDIVAGLNAGADDFLVKPIDDQVLLARVHALLRRAYPAEPGNRTEAFDGYVFNPSRQSVTVDGEEVALTSKEYALSLLFFRNPNRAFGRAYLLETVWGHSPDLATRTLDAHVSKIRSKLGLRPANGYRLAPVYSYGYRLERTADGAPDEEDE